MLRADAAQIQSSRELRRTVFEPTIFGEPAWDILLALCVIDNCQRRLSTGQLSKHSSLSLTTTLRWIDYLEEQSLVKRLPRAFDQRMVDVELSDKGRNLMHRYFTEVRQAVV